MEQYLELALQYLPMLIGYLPFLGKLLGYLLAGSGAIALFLKYGIPVLKWVSAKTPNTIDDKVTAFLDKLQQSGLLNKLASNPELQEAVAKAKSKKTATKKKSTKKKK